MRKLVKALSIIFVTILVLVVGVLIYINYTNTKLLTYNGNTSLVKGVDINYIDNLYKNNKIELNEYGEAWIYTYEDLGVKINWTDNLKEVVDKSFKLDLDTMDFEFITDKYFNAQISTLNNMRRDSEYAEFKFENGLFIIKEEIVGDKLDIDKLQKTLEERFDKDGVSVYLSDYYIPFDDTKPKASDFQKELDRFNNFEITYTNGFSITNGNIVEYLDLIDNKIVFKEELTEKAIKDMDNLIDIGLAEYDTVGGEWEFTTHSGDRITVEGGTWGDYFDSAKESEYIVEKIKSLESEINREPLKNQDYPDTIPNRYVEVSLDEQHLWFYDNGELVAESPVVTGLKNTMDTPEGVYFISEMIDGKYLRGADYTTWVYKWMRITNRGHGLHDAYWRSAKEFGGNTYKWDGSHGCINLPKKFAYELYDLLNVKDCVIIY